MEGLSLCGELYLDVLFVLLFFLFSLTVDFDGVLRVICPLVFRSYIILLRGLLTQLEDMAPVDSCMTYDELIPSLFMSLKDFLLSLPLLMHFSPPLLSSCTALFRIESKRLWFALYAIP